MKGIEYAIRAFALVHQKHPSTRFTVIGDGPLKEHLQNVINQLSLTESVKLVGWKSHDSIPQLLHSAHIFVLPSVTDKNGTQEGIPNAIMEAMATGMPVVSTYHAGIPEVVQDGVSGFLVPERDVQALANKLELLVSRPDIWQRMGKAGRDIIEKTHNIEKENDDLVAIFKRLIA
jgi:colanic acid/amylovoran biosynthesis glycosyltransferase